MNKSFRILASVTLAFATAMLAGCPTVPANGTVTQQSPQQIAALICPVIQQSISQLQTVGTTNANVSNDLSKASIYVTEACSVTAVVNFQNLQALVTTGVPALTSAIQASGMTPNAKQNTIFAIDGLEDIFVIVEALDPAIATSATAVTVPVAVVTKHVDALKKSTN